jgi:hypothetical protein
MNILTFICTKMFSFNFSLYSKTTFVGTKMFSLNFSLYSKTTFVVLLRSFQGYLGKGTEFLMALMADCQAAQLILAKK